MQSLLLAIARAIFLVHGGHDFSDLTEEAVRLRRNLGAPLPLSEALRMHANALIRQVHLDEALFALEEAERVLVPLGTQADKERINLKVQRATVLMNSRRIDDAVTVFEQALAGLRGMGFAETHGEVVDLRNRLGYALVQSSDPERGRVMLQDLVRDLRGLRPMPIDTMASIENNLGFSWSAQEDLPRAEAAFRESLALRMQQPKVDIVEVQHNRANLARALGELGRYDEAIKTAQDGHDAVVAKQDTRVSPRQLGYVRRLSGRSRMAPWTLAAGAALGRPRHRIRHHRPAGQCRPVAHAALFPRRDPDRLAAFRRSGRRVRAGTRDDRSGQAARRRRPA